jgi:hypothetical protein
LSPSKLKLLDRAIFIFICLFASTLTNSIFLNQIGYFGALALIIVRAVIRRQRIEKTGMESAFLFFILAEVLSTIFSAQTGSAALIMAKRIGMLSIVFTVFYSTDDIKTVKNVFIVYLIGGILTSIVYLFVAREHLVHNLYMLHVNGPSPFSHVMSTGGLRASVGVAQGEGFEGKVKSVVNSTFKGVKNE